MNQTFRSLIENRVTSGHFDPERTIEIDMIRKLVRLKTHAPSAFNLQNWRFIAVRSADEKERLREMAFRQQQVCDAAVTSIVCGELDGYPSGEVRPRKIRKKVEFVLQIY